jgi:hypothetical protein
VIRREKTREPSTALIKTFASRTNESALVFSCAPTRFLELGYDLIIGSAGCGNQLLHLFASNAESLQIRFVWSGTCRYVNPNSSAVPRDGDWRVRFKIRS